MVYNDEFSVYYNYDCDQTNVLTDLISNIEIEEEDDDEGYFEDCEMSILYQQCTL